MATWAEFEAAAPDLAAEGRRLLYRDGQGQAMLATVRGTVAATRGTPVRPPARVRIIGSGRDVLRSAPAPEG